jgi:hypothetical protein
MRAELGRLARAGEILRRLIQEFRAATRGAKAKVLACVLGPMG